MNPEPVQNQRHLSLDVIRGVAVMGILLANLPAFAFPAAAYFSPQAWGGRGPAEIAAWLANFVFVEGKMRGLFSVLFGASMLLVIERATAAGENPARVHYARMAVLFGIGLAHMYLIWWGDILAHYALVGAIAFLFHRLSAAQLFAAGLAVLATNLLWNSMGLIGLASSAARDTPQAVATWNSYAQAFGVPPRQDLLSEVAAMRGSWSDQVAYRWAEAEGPLAFLQAVGLETLAAMLIGMAAYRSGFLTGQWSREAYRRIALIGLGAAWTAYLALGLATIAHDFDQRWVFFGSIVGSVPFRIAGVIGYAALVMLLLRPGGPLTGRIAAVGRAAFTNYLGTSILVTGLFYGWGLGLFASLSRSQIYLVAPLVWLIMLAWSRPWLEQFRFGPLEWAWRSAARLELQSMRKPAAQQAGA